MGIWCGRGRKWKISLFIADQRQALVSPRILNSERHYILLGVAGQVSQSCELWCGKGEPHLSAN
jgi:hypothetical protein